MNILLTGYSGNLGGEIARALRPHRVLALVRSRAKEQTPPGVELVEGSLDELPDTRKPEIDCIIHGAASTAFKAPLPELRKVNVDGTARMLEFAQGCPRLRRIIHLSTTCVCGDREGLIEEAQITAAPAFINAYEQSKWEAETVVLASSLPVEIMRIAVVAGSEVDGHVRRPGAIHGVLYWLRKGLIPMMPALPSSRVDIISTEFVARTVAALLESPVAPGRIVHVSSGPDAPLIGELLEAIGDSFRNSDEGWRSGAVSPPDLVDAATYSLFEASVHQTGDALFRRVCDDARSFLPGLMHPRTMATSLATKVSRPDWRLLTERVTRWLIETRWGRDLSTPRHAHT